MSKLAWMVNVEEMVTCQYVTLTLAGLPKSFVTWIEAVDMIRELVGSKTRCHAFFNLVEFYGFTPAGAYSINVPFPKFD